MAELTFDEVRLQNKHRFEQVVDAFITNVLVKVRSRTPILTGTARAGWNRFPEGLSEAGTQQWIFNDVPYILKLEYGSSRQAPQGMARLTALGDSQAIMDEVVARFVT